MDREEARAVAESRLGQLRGWSYHDLLDRYYTGGGKEPEWETADGPSGTLYHLLLEAFWDAEPEANLRVWIHAEDESVDGSSRPEVASFIIAPDGSFVGED